AAFTLQVLEPHLNGPGGDVPVIVHDVRRGKTEVICGQGVAPAAATIAHYRSEGLDLVPGTGLLAAVVPGTFETWMLLLRDFGTMSLAEVLAPAIGYAQNGYPLLERAIATIATIAAMFRDHWPTSAAVYLPHIEVPLTYNYGHYAVCKTGPWGQGPVTLQQLALLKGFDLDGLDPTGPDFIHRIVEASKLAYADREAFYGDPDFVEVPMATLLS